MMSNRKIRSFATLNACGGVGKCSTLMQALNFLCLQGFLMKRFISRKILFQETDITYRKMLLEIGIISRDIFF